MPNNADSAPKRTLMYLDERLPGGFVIVCADDRAEHSFLLRRLGPSIECPHCGRTALSSRLIDAYYERCHLGGVVERLLNIQKRLGGGKTTLGTVCGDDGLLQEA